MGTPITFKLDISATYTHGNNTFSISGTDRSNYSSNNKPNFNGFIQHLYYEAGDNIEISFNSNDEDISFIIFNPNLDISFIFDSNNPNYTISFDSYDNYKFGDSSLNAYGLFSSYILKADTRINLFEYIESKYNAVEEKKRLQEFNITNKRFIGHFDYIKSDATRIGVDSYGVNDDLIIQSVKNDIHIVTGEKQRTSIWGNLDVRGNVNCTGNIPIHLIDGTNYDDYKLFVNNKLIGQYISQIVDGCFNNIEDHINNNDSSLSNLETLINVMDNSYNAITGVNALNNLDLSIQSIENQLSDEDGLRNLDLSIVVVDNSLTNLIKINEESKIIYDVSVNNGEYVINDVSKANLTLELGNIYQFKHIDLNETNDFLNFYTLSGNTYNDFSKNVRTIGNPDMSGYYTEIKVTNETPKILYYSNNNMGGKINIINSPTDTIELSGNFNNNILEVNANSQIYGIFNYKATTNLNITSLSIINLIENSKIIIILDSSIYDISLDILQINNTDDYYCNNNITNANGGDILLLNIKKIKNNKSLNITKYNKPLSRFISSHVKITDISSYFSYTPIFSPIDNFFNINAILKTDSWLTWNGSFLSGIPTNNEIGTEKVIFEVESNNEEIYFEESLTISVLSAIYYIDDFNSAVGTDIGNANLYGFHDKNFTVMFWIKPEFDIIYNEPNYRTCTIFGGAGPDDGQASNSPHCLLHYQIHEGVKKLRFDLNYWGISDGVYHYIDKPELGNWVFVCFQGYIDALDNHKHKINLRSYTMGNTLNENNIPEISEIFGDRNNWNSDYSPSGVSVYSIKLGQFGEPLTSNSPFITSNNNAYNKYIQHFAIYNSKISDDDMLSYFNYTKNNLSNFTKRFRNAVNYGGTLTLYGPDDESKIIITNNINGTYDIINNNSYGFIDPSNGIYDIYGNSVAGHKRFYNRFYIKFQLGRVNKEFVVGVVPNDNYPTGSDWGFLDYADTWLDYTKPGAMYIRFNMSNDYTKNTWLYHGDGRSTYYTNRDYRYGVNGYSHMVTYESVNNGRNTGIYDFAINNQQINDIVIIKYDGTHLNAALYDSNNNLKQTILNNITDYTIPTEGVIFDTMLIRDAYIKNLYLSDSIKDHATYYINDFNSAVGTNIGTHLSLGFTSGNFTILFWVKPVYSQNTGYATIIGGDHSGFHVFMSYTTQDGANKMRFDINYWGTTGYSVYISPPPTDNEWLFICFQLLNGTDFKLYNYTQESTKSFTSTAITTDTYPSSGVTSGGVRYIGQFVSALAGGAYVFNSNGGRAIKHFGIYNSKIPENDVISYFDVTKDSVLP